MKLTVPVRKLASGQLFTAPARPTSFGNPSYPIPVRTVWSSSMGLGIGARALPGLRGALWARWIILEICFKIKGGREIVPFSKY